MKTTRSGEEGPKAPKTDVLLILLVAVVWIYLLVESVARETRMERHFVLDGKGQPVEVYDKGGRR